MAVAACIVIAASGLSAMAQPGKGARHAVEPRDFSADVATPRFEERCIPANGAQIMGNFARPGDSLDSVTGEVCRR
jgi:hypothetical protein